jgi:hypothetical protein
MNTVSPLSVPTRRGLSWIPHPKTPQIDGTQEFRQVSEFYGNHPNCMEANIIIVVSMEGKQLMGVKLVSFYIVNK